uniref:ATP-binding cassette sub-family G member 20 n=1 Tax=Lepeophtheirus salmonis TaxID=72036 RepID=A0A0K2U568_LEPSM
MTDFEGSEMDQLQIMKNDNEHDPRAAISVKGAYKSFGWGKKKVNVLVNLSIRITKGHIYGLLGPSGSGKTTLLQCVIGKQSLDSGSILVFGEYPGTKDLGVPGKRVGYMPQDLAMYMELTIMETLEFYGRIFNMPKAKIKKRAKFLVELLELPKKKILIQKLSGGHQRRASLAVALLHEPDLLILDEPTVGVDPVLRRNIWGHLVDICNNPIRKTTIVVTTHYVDEARQANMVGMMRFGRILAQNCPSRLLKIYNKPTLEAVFFNLCVRDESEISIYSCETCESDEVLNLKVSDFRENYSKVTIPYPSKKNCPRLSSLLAFHRLKALVLKNFVRMWRNITFLLFQFIIPTIQVTLFCIAIGRDIKGLSMAVVNDDIVGKECNGYAKECYHQSIPFISFAGNDQPKNISCLFLQKVDEAIIDLVHYKEYKTAKDAVIAGKHWGVIHFLNGFSDAFRWRLGALFQKEDVDIKKINTSYIYIDLDTTNQQVMYSLKRSLYETFRSFSKELLTECYDIKNVEGYPAKYEKPIYGSINPTFTEFMAPGIILSIAFFMAVGLTAQSFILERNDGLLERAWVAGVTSAENMLAYMIAQFVVVIFQVTFAIVFLIYVFQIPSVGSLWLLGLLTTFQGVCGMSLGLLISALCNHEQDAIQVALGLFYPTLLLSGIVWPIEGMPSSLKYVSYIFPQTIACEAMRGILSRGWDPRWKVVFLGFVATTIWIFIFQILGALILRFKR